MDLVGTTIEIAQLQRSKGLSDVEQSVWFGGQQLARGFRQKPLPRPRWIKPSVSGDRLANYKLDGLPKHFECRQHFSVFEGWT
jgi:hypothetical protein